MSYIISYSDPAKASYPITVADNTIYNGVGTGSLKLVGKNYPAYGQPVAENFIHLLENFASSTPPVNPVEGQLWYDNATGKLRLNNGTANNTNWKPVNGLYQQGTQPIDAVIGDVWVDTVRNQIFINNGTDFSTLVGPSYSSAVSAGPIVITDTDNQGNAHQIVKFYIDGNEQAVLTSAAYTPLSPPYGFSSYQAGINLINTSLFNGTADSANYLRQSGIKVSGSSFMRNDQSQSITGQLTVQIDGNALLIGADPTFILERTSNGSNANFVNNYKTPGYGTFTFNIKDANAKNIPVLTIGGNPQQVVVSSYTTATSKSTGALVVNGGVGIGGDLFVGGNIRFTNPYNSTLTVATVFVTSSSAAISTMTGAFTVTGGVGVGDSVYIGNNLSVTNRIYDSNGKSGNSGDVLVSQGNKIIWTSYPFGGTSTNVTSATISGFINITGATSATSTNTGALTVAGGAGIGLDLWVNGLITGTNIYSKALAVANSGTFNTVVINGTTASTTPTTGALVVAGGVGISGDVHVQGTVYANILSIQNTTITSTSTVVDDVFRITTTTDAISLNTASLVVLGGASITKNILAGNQIYVKTGANTSPSPVAGLWPVSTQTYVLPAATSIARGGVKVGTSLSINVDVLDVNTATLMTTSTYAQFVTSTATQTRLGGIVIGSNLTVDGLATVSVATATNSTLGLVSVDLNEGIYVTQGRIGLTTATNIYIGGVRLGENVLSRTNGTLYIDTSTLLVATAVSIASTATANTLGGIKIGQNVNISSSGTISVSTGAGYVLPFGNTSTIGGVKQNSDFPSIVINQSNGELELNVNFIGSTGTQATLAWNTATSQYDLSYYSSPANTGYNVAYNTIVTQDNLQARVTTSGVVQIKASTTTMSAYWSAYQMISGQLAMSPTVNTGASLSTSTWTNIGTSNNLSSGGDTIIANVQDQTAGRLYRVTYIHTAGVSSASAVIERLI